MYGLVRSFIARNLMIVALSAVLVLSTAPAKAEINPDGLLMVRVEASDGFRTASYDWLFKSDDIIPGGFKQIWNGFKPLTSEDGTVLAYAGDITSLVLVDPLVELNHSVIAGASETSFTVSTILLEFDPIVNPIGWTSAGITVTDNNGNGAMATPLTRNSKIYQALYNNDTMVFADLIDGVTADPFDSNRVDDFKDITIIPGAVSSIKSVFSFKLTAYDSASLNSQFEVVPEPSAIALLGLGLLPLLRRRK